MEVEPSNKTSGSQSDVEQLQREVDILHALEKIRERTMAMRESSELREVVSEFFRQVQDLGIQIQMFVIFIHNEDGSLQWWGTEFGDEGLPNSYHIPISDEIINHPRAKNLKSIIENNISYQVFELEGEDKKSWDQYLLEKTELRQLPIPIQEGMRELDKIVLCDACCRYGILEVAGPSALDEENSAILMRFASVFEQTYTRFLDVQNAENRAHEAEIQLCLERVRAHTMAMQKSDELKEVIATMYEQFQVLGFDGWGCALVTRKEVGTGWNMWLSVSDQEVFPTPYEVPVFDDPVQQRFLNAWDQAFSHQVIEFEGTEKQDYDSRLFYQTNWRTLPDDIKRMMQAQDHVICSMVVMPNSVLEVVGPWSLPDDKALVLERFAKVFEQTYTRFLDLKKAEEQVREARIEASLERVRARAMAMHSSSELGDAAEILYKQMQSLGLTFVRSGYAIIDEKNKLQTLYMTSHHGTYIRPYKIPLIGNKILEARYESWKNQDLVFSQTVGGQSLEDHIKFVSHHFGSTIAKYTQDPTYFYFGNFSKGYLLILASDNLLEDQVLLIPRFVKVFEQAYTRFLDLQKAEAQAREAQIEAALERVRSRTMGMHKSEELADAASVLFQQIISLGLKPVACSFIIVDKDKKTGEVYISADGTVIPDSFVLPYHGEPAQDRIFNSWKRGDEYIIVDLKGKPLEHHLQFIAQNMPVGEMLKASGEPQPERLALHIINFRHGFLGINYLEPHEEVVPILQRFAKVFEQTYTRFLDLQKAEAQAREAQIEAALERVRSRSMGMHKSDELAEIVGVMFTQLQELHFGLDGAVILGIPVPGTDDTDFWLADVDKAYPMCFRLPYHDSPPIKDMWDTKQSGNELLIKTYSRDRKNQWFEFAFESTDLHLIPKDRKQWILDQEYLSQAFIFREHFALGIHNHFEKALSSQEVDILRRFANVFEQAYVRYLDIQKAEEQAREAQIEAALERIRSRSMAMHSSTEIKDVVNVLRQQMGELDQPGLQSCVIHIYTDNTSSFESWYAFENSEGELVSGTVQVPVNEAKLIAKWIKGYHSNETEYQIISEGHEMKEWQQLRNTLVPGMQKAFRELPDKQYYQFSDFKGGSLAMVSENEPSAESIELQKRAASVFGLAYTRFLDLQKAEEQAKEAQIEAALERVRSRSLAMHKSDELNEVIAVLYEQLQELHVGEWGSSLNIFNEEENYFDIWLSTDTQRISAQSFRIEGQNHPVIKQNWDIWNSQKQNQYIELKGVDKARYDEYAMSKTGLKNLPGDLKKAIKALPKAYSSFAAMKYGSLISYSGEYPLSEAEFLILQRFAKVFEQAYTRFLDLQKAEEQTREAEIQLSLERIRARTMAMHRTEELNEVVAVIFDELNKMGFEASLCSIGIYEKESKGADWWSYVEGKELPGSYHFPYFESRWFKEVYEAWHKKKPYHYIEIYGKEKEELDRLSFEETDWKNLPEEVKLSLQKMSPDQIKASYISMNCGMLEIVTDNPLTNDQINLLQRFTKVIDHTYTRVVDLQKSEAQAREAEIQLGLERVRARGMAMQNSKELRDLIATVFFELTKLDLVLTRCIIMIYNPETMGSMWWMANSEDPSHPSGYFIKYHEEKPYLAYIKAWKERHSRWQYILEGEEKIKWDQVLFSQTELTSLPDLVIEGMKAPTRVYLTASFNDFGALSVASLEFLTEEQIDILTRFARSFDQNYTRFLDVQRAEAQAREAEIQLALERIRARSMAMQKSEELSEVVGVMYREVEKLEIASWGSALMIFDDELQNIQMWFSENLNNQHPRPYNFNNLNHEVVRKWWEFWGNEDEFMTIHLKDDTNADWINYMFEHTGMKDLPAEVKEAIRSTNEVFFAYAKTKQGLVAFIDLEPFSEMVYPVLKRFASTFEQAYTRFLDVQRAEEQARESQIEASLEKIRARAMAMQKSDELCEVVGLVSEELNISLENTICIIMNFDWKSEEIEWWSTGFNVDNLPESYKIPIRDTIKDHPLIRHYREAIKKGISYKVYKLEGEVKRSWDNYIFEQSDLKKIPLETQNWMRSYEGVICNEAFMSHGVLEVDGPEQLSDEKAEILQRFAKVVDLTYKRIEDLQQAEARAVEAVRQASLDRVRGEIASMRTKEDLKRITPLIWKELTALQVPFIRCGVMIMDEDKEVIQSFLSAPDGHSLGVFDLPFESKGFAPEAYKHWREGTIYRDRWNKNQFAKFTENLINLGLIKDKLSYMGAAKPPESLDLHFVPFKQGMLYVGNTEPLTNDAIQLAESLARAFSIAYARYEDFKKLEEAKQKIEEAFSHLEAAQSQLVHAEKMASLGELTAGIAHEIQNPLNFVNNFSEVSAELIEEAEKELLSGDIEGTQEVLKDLIENLNRITHHGRRADAIVKGMLQHSRSGSGEKELTDINALCDEYLRLAYHGIKAREKGFNANYELDLGPDLPKIKVVPQDIGRVLLNLINNAFQAVSGVENGKVYISTRTLKDKIEVTIVDNGHGIPEEIKDKIFQPFFTTKATGQGTGLGLSLSYDIVTKGHNGKLYVKSKVGVGSEFSIQLSIN